MVKHRGPRFRSTRHCLGILSNLAMLGFLSLHGAEGKSDQGAPAPTDYPCYSNVTVFNSLLKFHTNSMSNLQRTNLLKLTIFYGDVVYHDYCVRENGVNDLYLSDTLGVKSGPALPVSADGLRTLRSALLALPAKNDSPPAERIFLLSYRDGTNWVTRIFDRENLPKPARQIDEIVSVGMNRRF